VPKRKLKILGDWRDKAYCVELQMVPEDFFPEKSHVKGAEAKRVCRACPVRIDCLEEALTNGEKFGIWGGLDNTERQAESKRRRAQRNSST